MVITCGALESEKMISNANRLFDLVQQNKKIESTHVVFNGETHGSVSSAAMSRGLYYLYGNKYKALLKQGISYYKKQDYATALEQFVLAFETYPKQIDEDDQYDIACLYALTGNADKAFQYLQGLANSNFDDYDHIIKDSDFNSLHDDQRWKEIISLVKQNNKKTARK